MKLKNKDIDVISGPFGKLAEYEKLTSKDHYWAVRFLSKIKPIVTDFAATRQFIMRKHADRNDNGELASDANNNMTFFKATDEFQADIDELMDREFTLVCENGGLLDNPRHFPYESIKGILSTHDIVALETTGIIIIDWPEEATKQ